MAAEQRNIETLTILRGIQQQGQNLWFYNQSHLMRIKILKEELFLSKTFETEIFTQIENVIKPFQIMITSKNLQIFLVKMQKQEFRIK